MPSLRIFLLILAMFCFGAAFLMALFEAPTGRVNLIALGLTLWVGSTLVPS